MGEVEIHCYEVSRREHYKGPLTQHRVCAVNVDDMQNGTLAELIAFARANKLRPRDVRVAGMYREPTIMEWDDGQSDGDLPVQRSSACPE